MTASGWRPSLMTATLLAILATSSSVAAQQQSAPAPHSYQGANTAYEQGNWTAAIAGYEALVAAGVSHEDLYYNLANAFLRADRLGPAIYNYERALRLAPDFSDARHNLAIARAEVARRWQDRMKSAETEPTWIRVVTYLRATTLGAIFVACNLLFFGCLIGVRLLGRGPARSGLIAGSLFTGLAVFLAGAVLAGSIYFTRSVKLGIVLDDQLHMRDGAYEQSGEGALIHAGLRVRIIGRESGWVNIRLNNGHEGWVPAKSLGEL